MRTTTTIDDHLPAEVKALAARQQRTLSEVVVDSLRRTIRVSAEPSRHVTLPTSGNSDERPLDDILDKRRSQSSWVTTSGRPGVTMLIADVSVICERTSSR